MPRRTPAGVNTRGMELNHPPASSGPAEGRQPIGRITAIVLTLGFVLGSATAFVFAIGTSLCSLFGEICSDAEQNRITVLTGMGFVFGIGGPILVAWLRRAAVWALTPLILAAGGIGAFWIVQMFDL